MHRSNRTLYIIKTGNTLTYIRERHGDFEDWIAQGLNIPGVKLQHWDPRVQGDWPSLEEIAGVVVTGSPAMVTDRAEWSERTAAWLKTLVEREVPVLGICYGHQLLAHALGGQVGPHPAGIEIGTVEVQSLPAAENDPLFAPLPRTFRAQVVHEQTVVQLPAEAVALAHNGHEPHHAFRVGPCAWGIQFHPEFSAEIMRDYLSQVGCADHATEPFLQAQAAVTPTPASASLLPAFARWVKARQQP